MTAAKVHEYTDPMRMAADTPTKLSQMSRVVPDPAGGRHLAAILQGQDAAHIAGLGSDEALQHPAHLWTRVPRRDETDMIDQSVLMTSLSFGSRGVPGDRPFSTLAWSEMNRCRTGTPPLGVPAENKQADRECLRAC